MVDYPKVGVADIECANRKCDWRGKETNLVPDHAPKVEPRGPLTATENVCPKCKHAGYYFVEGA